jgi:hypothetical protein
LHNTPDHATGLVNTGNPPSEAKQDKREKAATIISFPPKIPSESLDRNSMLEQPMTPVSPPLEPVNRPFLGPASLTARSPLLYPQPEDALVDDDAFFGGLDHPLVTDTPDEIPDADSEEEGAEFVGDNVHTDGVPRSDRTLDAR